MSKFSLLQKIMADLNKSTEPDQNNPELELVNIGNTTKESLVEGLLEKQLECPYPNHEGYSKVRNTITPDQQKDMKENIKVTSDGKIEIINMKKSFSILTAQHNGRDIFYGNHLGGVTYLTGKAAEKESKNQGKKLLRDKSEVEQFINFFPGENTEKKVFNLINLFGLEKAGYWSVRRHEWDSVGSVGYVYLSGVNGNDDVYGITWNNFIALIGRYGQEFTSPFLVFEDC